MDKGSSWALIHRLRRSFLSRRARVLGWEDGFCDFAFGSAQNDRLGGIRGKSDYFISEIPTIKEPGALSISF
ncbi:MAG: hypothetical protein ACO3OZ_04225 [bacterium]